jgi:hypothetical protein
MSKQPIVQYRQRGFQGLLTASGKEEIPQGLSPNLQNVSLRNGVLSKSIGSTSVGNAAPAGELVVSLGVMSYESNGVITRSLMRLTHHGALTTTRLEQWNGASWAEVSSWIGNVNFTTSMLGLQDLFFVAGVAYTGVYNPKTPASGDTIPDIFGCQSLMSFGDRLVRIGTENAQSLDWSVDGDPLDFTGFGSGAVQLVDIRGDAVDDLMVGIPVGHNNFALFRKTSIMRGFETGSEELAIGLTHWIDGIGVIARTAACMIDNGVFFIGSDRAAYILEASGGLVPIGTPIKDILEDSSAIGASKVVYDAKHGEVWIHGLGFELVFDLSFFRSRGQPKWRKESYEMLGALYDNGELYYTTANQVYRMASGVTTRVGATFEGMWESPPLNNMQDFRELSTLTLIELSYSSTEATTIIVEAKADNGEWTMPLSGTPVTIANTAGTLKTVSVGFNITGFDVRFRIRFNQASRPNIHAYEPRLVVRGGKEYAS